MYCSLSSICICSSEDYQLPWPEIQCESISTTNKSFEEFRLRLKLPLNVLVQGDTQSQTQIVLSAIHLKTKRCKEWCCTFPPVYVVMVVSLIILWSSETFPHDSHSRGTGQNNLSACVNNCFNVSTEMFACCLGTPSVSLMLFTSLGPLTSPHSLLMKIRFKRGFGQGLVKMNHIV